ncbi:hypothetical protein BJ085DRAFT_23323, partial [Dimargaris cristalligena]
QLAQEARVVRDRCAALEADHAEQYHRLIQETLKLPNDTHPTTPEGDENQATIVKMVGKPRTVLVTPSNEAPNPIPYRDHLTLCQELDLVDFQAAATVTGSSFYYLKREAALLELALVQYAMQKAVARGFIPVLAPDLVRQDIMHGCGFRPRNDEANQTYFVSAVPPSQPGRDTNAISTSDSPSGSSSSAPANAPPPLCLTATAEIPLAGLFTHKRVELRSLPQKLVAFGHCFRAEAGARGAETRGLYRVHQFSKVELFMVSDPQHSDRALEEIRELQEDIIGSLGICYRVLDMPTFELGASAYKKYDIEAWMPGRQAWGEISSASNCTDYQSRRLNIRFHPTPDAKAPNFAHTLNGTACAVPRLIIAILETFQTPSGEVIIPEPLRPWMMGISKISPIRPSP